MIKIKFYGHACFSLEKDGQVVLIDPWLRENPVVSAFPEGLRPALILATHGHHDHLGDAVEISKRVGCPILAVPELVSFCAKQGATTTVGHYGGTLSFDFGTVKIVPAWHTSSVMVGDERVYAGSPCGFVIRFHGRTFYHAGDTALFGDMKLIGDATPLDYAFLPIGDLATMGIEDAVVAVELLRPRLVIPMHYNTWERIAQDPQGFKGRVEARTPTRCLILHPGEEHEVPV